MQHLGVQLHKNVSGVRIEQGAVVYSNYRGQERCLASDHVIVAQGASANPVLAEALQTNVVLTSLLCHAEGDGAEAIVQALSCNTQFASMSDVTTRAAEAARCKTRLGPYLAASAALMASRVTARLSRSFSRMHSSCAR